VLNGQDAGIARVLVVRCNQYRSITPLVLHRTISGIIQAELTKLVKVSLSTSCDVLSEVNLPPSPPQHAHRRPRRLYAAYEPQYQRESAEAPARPPWTHPAGRAKPDPEQIPHHWSRGVSHATTRTLSDTGLRPAQKD